MRFKKGKHVEYVILRRSSTGRWATWDEDEPATKKSMEKRLEKDWIGSDYALVRVTTVLVKRGKKR